MRAAGALSTHPIVATALGECAGQVLEALDGARPALVLVGVTPPHLGTLEDVARAIRAVLQPSVVVGAVSSAVVGGGRHVEGVPALCLFALAGVEAVPLLLEPDGRGGLRRQGHGGRAGAPATGLVLADPFSCTAAGLTDALAGLQVAGGLVGAARGPGGSRLLLDGAVRTTGAIGALVGPARAVASQGGTPLGSPWAVTRADADVVLELAGRPAARRWREALGDDEGPAPAALALLLDEQTEHAGRQDLQLVPVVGPSRDGGLRLARPVAVGRVVRFVRTGPAEAEADLVATLAVGVASGIATLLFPGPDRGGDAELVAEVLQTPSAGVAVVAPLAPLARSTALHGPGASALLLVP